MGRSTSTATTSRRWKRGPQLKRFLAVGLQSVPLLYRRQQARRGRRDAGGRARRRSRLFQSTSDSGPFTIESDLMKQKFGVSIGVVSLPATYRDHPVIWAGLSHEVGGHDVVHADAGLLEEMVKQGAARCWRRISHRGAITTTAALNALIWSYWMDEAAADVYGVLNMGPIFALNLAGFLAAFRARQRGQTDAGRALRRRSMPKLRPDGQHGRPPDRSVALLHRRRRGRWPEGTLRRAKRNDYVAEHRGCRRAGRGRRRPRSACGDRIEIGAANSVDVHTNMKLSEAADAARKVGKMLATAQV